MIKAVLFDADGVLVDGCELHFVALNRALATMGWSIPRNEHIAFYNGLPTHRKLKILTDTKGFPEDWHEAVHRLKQEFTQRAIEECLNYAPEKRELLEKLRACGLRIAVCSNSLHSTVELMLKAVGIDDLCDEIFGNDDVEAPKPSSEIYLLAAKRLGASIGQCLIVEDSPVGLEAAYAARPLQVLQVSGPHEVNMSLMPKIQRFFIPLREVA